MRKWYLSEFDPGSTPYSVEYTNINATTEVIVDLTKEKSNIIVNINETNFFRE